MGSEKTKEPLSVKQIFQKASNRALGGGLSGAAAMGLQVTSLIWLRTTMNYQYRNGGTTTGALRTLYADGGVRRFYRGYSAAIFQGPLSRFGDVAANQGMLTLLDSLESTKDMNVGLKTAAASGAASLWRIFLMPIDTTKTIMQVEGKNGIPALVKKVKTSGPRVMYAGALGAAGATYVGHYPWFFTFNYLQANLPEADGRLQNLARNAFSGFCASVVSDTCSNSVRVLKTTKQTSTVAISYPQALRLVVEKDGWLGLFGRGLRTRILANGIQGLMFAVLLKQFQAIWEQRQQAKEAVVATPAPQQEQSEESKDQDQF